MTNESSESKVRKDKAEKGYHKLIIWQKARELVILIYKYTNNFPASEEFGLKGQLRRAAVSIVLNIVEGHRRSSKKEFLHFLDIAISSLTEVEAALELCLDLGLVKDEDFIKIDSKITEEAYLLTAFIKGLKR